MNMINHPVKDLVHKADEAINNEDYDTLSSLYAEDAVFVLKIGMHVVGRENIKSAFQSLGSYFNHSLNIRQEAMEIIETGDTAVVLARTIISSNNHPEEQRNATYIFRKNEQSQWHCILDNSYSHKSLEQ